MRSLSFTDRFKNTFFAYYILFTNDIDIAGVISGSVFDFYQGTDLIETLHDMNPDKMECYFFVPVIRDIVSQIENVDPFEEPHIILSIFLGMVSVEIHEVPINVQGTGYLVSLQQTLPSDFFFRACVKAAAFKLFLGGVYLNSHQDILQKAREFF
jgi:hypothetical protein